MAKADDMANARPTYLHTTRVSETRFQYDSPSWCKRGLL
jgi:hypothetical protein